MSELNHSPLPFVHGWGNGITGPNAAVVSRDDPKSSELITVFDPVHNCQCVVAILPHDGVRPFPVLPKEEAQANAEYIVTAANAHPDLLARIEELEGGATLEGYLRDQWAWSKETFGPGNRTKGVCSHIRKEVDEILADPFDLSEWIDVVILAMDGFWRHGGKPEDLLPAMLAKQKKNFAREWPTPTSEDDAVEHVRATLSKEGGVKG